MEAFTERFLDRIKEMRYDKDVEVFPSVIELLCLLYGNIIISL